ncbi:fibronectin type III domain-containing protein [Anaeromyxobacter oryzae]|uniref:Fibronectin type-III domain-containing protein n=1 Tax=Anaeromyxobacter oryzae TaxID=2918170 RepID=A0ABM7X0E1_9BACT|nr:fibronectin type III domain-containing protein [Anaeromyxobacter oryzae]BDG05256.1 hypothetical protein AMOR_42520 [Anaeromyxobacter oryzae]
MRSIGAVAVVCAVVALSACGRQGTTDSAVDPNAFAAADGPVRQVEAAATAPACGGTGAHDRHAATSIVCASCHPCGGTYGFANAQTFPGGTDPSTGTVVRGGGTTSCTVACHYPLGASQQTVTWSTPGPLACSACHSNVAPANQTYRSAHAVAQVDPTANRSACQSCHETSLHTSGHVRIDVGSGIVDASVTDPVQLNGICQGCHGGTGRTISGQTPPVLPGWTSSTGDFHGARAGTGFGGTLAAPYKVGQGPLACTECHDPHASQNAFLFASTAGGVPVVPAAIDRAGVGAEMLCANCHLGNRHAGCMISNCHGSDPVPAGKPCFFCHGHEGIVNFTLPTWDNHPNGNGNYCNHCHTAGWFPVVEYTAPRFSTGPTVVAAATSATVTWTTDEPATSYVEMGTSSAALGTTVGNGTLTTTHQVTLPGLTQLTTYAFRVRSSDAFRNVAFSSLASFTTPSAYAPPAPALTPQPDFIYEYGATPPPASYTATFQWSAVRAPDGHPVQYRFQLATDASFSAPMVDAWISPTTVQQAFPVNEFPGATYYWRVQARDAVDTGYAGPWTQADGFQVYWYMPY